MTNRLKVAVDCVRMVRWQGKHKIVGDDRAIAKALLAELGVNGAERHERLSGPRTDKVALVRWIGTEDELAKCQPGTVLRDRDERVLELWPNDNGWWLTGEEGGNQDVYLPARVLYTPEDES
jgi:hypothetical protein